MTEEPLKIDCGYPGGNILIDRIEGDTIYLRPDLRDTKGHWFYWNFRIQGASGRTLRFVFSGGLCIGARGPAFSRDDGATWQWLEQSEIPDAEAFSYGFSKEDACVRFAFCLPYTLEHWQAFLPTLPDGLEAGVLAETPKGRPVPFLRSTRKEDKPVLVLTARHHCCETAPSFVLEGLIEEWNSDTPFSLMVIPFVDLDGVEAGDQGKNRRPHDHNRDYSGPGIYPETRALRERIGQIDRPFMVLDLHCPYVREGDSETVYLVGSPSPAMAKEQDRFGSLLEHCAQGLPYSRSNDVPFGSKWNTAENFRQGKSFTSWAEEQANCKLASTMEIPYANAQGAAVTAQSCKRFGASLLQAVQQYLETPDQPCP